MNLSRDYIKLPLEDFGRQLVETNDLDPVYVALNKALPLPLRSLQLRRWLLAYWCCYHAGLASWLSETENRHEHNPFARTFWTHMADMAENIIPSPLGDRWPRGRERRHFRGQKAVDAIRTLCQRYPEPERAVFSLESVTPIRYEDFQKKVCEWPLFGPWIAFKVADMLERLMGVDIDFSQSGVLFYDSPRKAAELWACSNGASIFGAPTAAMKWLAQELHGLNAPPNYNRPLGVQEYETILCKWKAHQDGIYPVGIDTVELVHALSPWATVSPTASRMLDVFTTRT